MRQLERLCGIDDLIERIEIAPNSSKAGSKKPIIALTLDHYHITSFKRILPASHDGVARVK